MWKQLNTKYDTKSDENLNMVPKQFFHFKWEEFKSVAQNSSRLEQLAAKMKALDCDVGEKMLITRILTMLPKKFNHFHSAWVPSICNLGSKVESKSDTLQLWHERLCYQSVKHVKEFLKNLNVNFVDDGSFFFEGCAYGKHHQ